jgi:U4/U6 small nuclear ribonucleoprotein PRP3
MASTQTNGLKRPHPDDEPDSAQKKARSATGSPATQSNGRSAEGKVDVSKIVAEARAKAAALAASGGMSLSAQEKIAALRARVAAATSKAGAMAPQRSAAMAPRHQPPQHEDNAFKARGGLDIGLHPALMADAQDNKVTKGKQAMQPKFATTMANRQVDVGDATEKAKKRLDLSGPSIEEIKSNPYFDPSLGSKNANRGQRHLNFNPKGKYAQQGAALRRQAALEAMKKRIAESSRRAGIDEDLDAERAFLVPQPPEIEWWDEGLVNGKDYSVIDNPGLLKLEGADSIITIYIQHPVALEPPQEKNVPAPKPMFLTPKEQKKLRRQRRMAELKEQQAKIRLGLEPAPPPKVKKGNMMRVLGEEAVKDPTAVEARVNREIAERFEKHMTTNDDRKLTKEQRHEKLAQQQAQDAAKGIHSMVFKIDSLANGRHRFKINKNAEQHGLTGICILNPKFCLVIVEGGIHSITAYRKLMLNRIDWTENVAPNAEVREGNREVMVKWLEANDEKGELKSLASNHCQLVWEGELKDRAFRKWSSRVCETDKEARETLSRMKMDSFWTVAKNLDAA